MRRPSQLGNSRESDSILSLPALHQSSISRGNAATGNANKLILLLHQKTSRQLIFRILPLEDKVAENEASLLCFSYCLCPQFWFTPELWYSIFFWGLLCEKSDKPNYRRTLPFGWWTKSTRVWISKMSAMFSMSSGQWSPARPTVANFSSSLRSSWWILTIRKIQKL